MEKLITIGAFTYLFIFGKYKIDEVKPSMLNEEEAHVLLHEERRVVIKNFIIKHLK